VRENEGGEGFGVPNWFQMQYRGPKQGEDSVDDWIWGGVCSLLWGEPGWRTWGAGLAGCDEFWGRH
jgi:hypothetical protein